MATLASDPRLVETIRKELGGELLAVLASPTTNEVLINPDGEVWVDDHGRGLFPLGLRFEVHQTLALLSSLAAYHGQVLNERSAALDGKLPPEIAVARICALVPPVAEQPTLSIRRKNVLPVSLDDYVERRILAAGQVAALRRAIAGRRNVLISGGTGTGKTTLLQCLAYEAVRLCGEATRFVILEDTPELLNPGPNTVRLLSGAYTLAQLFRYTLRLRPDRIVVGEVRGAEALQLLKALTTGHPGGFATLHAESARLSLDRLEDYVAEAGVTPRPALLVAAVQVLVHIEGRGEERRVEELYQLDGWDPAAGRYRLSPLAS